VRSAPCTWRQGAWVSWLNLKTKVDSLLVVGLRNTGTVCQWFDLKTTGMVFSVLASKPVVTVSLSLTSKPVAGFLVEPQN
jgi:hypothetical protein